MTPPRFYVAPDHGATTGGATLEAGAARGATSGPETFERALLPLPADVARHAVQVLRLRDGAPIVLFDGRGGEWEAQLVLAGRLAHARVLRHVAVEREAPHALRLVQAIVAPDAMDDIVRQAVELGAAGVTPLIAARTQRAPSERVERRVARWRQIAVAGCEQCGRNRVPQVDAPAALDAWLAARGDCGGVLVLDPRAGTSLPHAVAARVPDAVMVGPEGGFTQAELDALTAAGARAVRLGPAVLRADTAAAAALAAIQAAAQLAAATHG
jgi:16S rRNA (uracil1498-N3)-methyltransferase